jgi:hypothetical protein
MGTHKTIWKTRKKEKRTRQSLGVKVNDTHTTVSGKKKEKAYALDKTWENSRISTRQKSGKK